MSDVPRETAPDVITEMSDYVDPPDYHRALPLHAFYAEMVDLIVRRVEACIQEQGSCRILELGPGTGNVTVRLASLPNTMVTAVELDQFYLEYAQGVCFPFPDVELVQGDMVTYRAEEPADVVVLSFSYDHVKPERREALAKNINANLTENGVCLLGTELLRPYDPSDDADWRRALHDYHSRIIELAEEGAKQMEEGGDEEQAKWYTKMAEIERTALHSGLEKIADFKPNPAMLEAEMALGGMVVEGMEKMGPEEDGIGGVYVCVFRKGEEEN